MLLLRVACICLTFMVICRAQQIISLNNYGDSTYPDRCVIDMGRSLVLLKTRESIKLESLPCTMILCIGDGWGMLQTCSHDAPPDDCRFSSFDWDAEYPKCCHRRIICD